MTFVFFVATLGLAGCGGGTSNITGKVYHNGELLKGGNVTFVRADGRDVPAVSASIQEDGTYSAVNVAAGKVKICVETESINPRGKTAAPTYSPPKDAPVPPGGYDPASQAKERSGKFYRQIPAKYADPETTDLTLEVTSGNMTHDIHLE